MFVQEAGTDLIRAGVSPAVLKSMLPFQTRVAALQLRREAAANEEAAKLERAGERALIVCDRGIADGAAYLAKEEYALVLNAIGLTAKEALLRYDAVFCLESTARLATGAYTRSNNASRSETAEEAAALDERTFSAWWDHPRFHAVANEQNFEAKFEKLFAAIASWREFTRRLPLAP